MEQGQLIPIQDNKNLSEHCVSLQVCEDFATDKISVDNPPRIYVYSVAEEADLTEMEDAEAEMVSFTQWTLPCPEFEGLWESLVYDDDLKPSLLHYAETAMLFSDSGIDSNVISCNRGSRVFFFLF